MTPALILASGSEIRISLLRNAGLDFEVQIPRVDEEAVKDALLLDGAKPRDIADALADLKSQKVAAKHFDAMVIGCDQVLSFDGDLLSKPNTQGDACDQLRRMRGKSHMLLSAAVIHFEGKPVWRHVGQVRLRMRTVTDAYIDDYVARNWSDIRHAVGAYQLEAEGVRLIQSIEGDYFHVLGMPLLEVLDYLTVRGVIEG